MMNRLLQHIYFANTEIQIPIDVAALLILAIEAGQPSW